ncbi:PRTRC system ThiF family protein [Polaromonas naphthalenivorans]|uniref:UBA/THIF-type NAD/FAD binding protein n=1 Tax=Polaromonas naphthalenivorans (strain CJ2) TaxID=365044 RepID=A1VVA2_POLNA|nr:PRTRC system ThiF family protein [Polaromonas naphthalenivorans]ABM39580.1 UBA/THIF-type NAD/FAD binding protein [Polaromonas naphthalenivorans CJ2]
MKHKVHPELIRRAINVVVIGAGGTGSRVIEGLACLHRAIKAKGHPFGLKVSVIDPDTVSEANVGRQAFYPCDVGHSKAHTLVNRVNMALNGEAVWTAYCEMVTLQTDLSSADIVIGAVDNRKARLAILRSLENVSSGNRYWLDLGNRISDGQVILGEVTSRKRKTDDPERLPHAGELYPELIDPAMEPSDDVPSCSLAEALEKQALFINPAVCVQAMNLLWLLLTKGELEIHGAFINLEFGTVLPLRVDPQQWARFGVVRNGKRQKVVRPSAQKIKAAATA